MAESSTTGGNRLGGGPNDFQRTGFNNWNFPTTMKSDHSNSNRDSASEYSNVSEVEPPHKDKGKGRARSENGFRSRSRSPVRERPRSKTKKSKQKNSSKRRDKNQITRPPPSRSRSGRSRTRSDREYEMVDLEANHGSRHRESQRRRGGRDLGVRRKRRNGTLFGIGHFWLKMVATIVILAIFFGMMAFFIKRVGASAPDHLNRPAPGATPSP